MKKISFLTFFITAHIVLIFLQVHKYTLFIKNSYNQQQCEKTIATFTNKKQTLTQELYALKDRENIKRYAQNKLGMRPYALNQVKKLHYE
jgi:cell division protein FtsL